MRKATTPARSSACFEPPAASAVSGVAALSTISIAAQYQVMEFGASASNTTLDGSDGATANGCGFLVREPMNNDEDQRFATQRRQLLHGVIEILDHQGVFLRCRLRNILADLVKRRRHNALPSERGYVLIPQDGEHPCLEISALLKLIGGCEGTHHRVLHQVVYEIMLAAKNARKCA